MLSKSLIQLQKNCKLDSSGLPRHKIAVLGDFATQHLAAAIKGYAYEVGLAFDVFDADYNQIDAQLLDEGSEYYAFGAATVLLCMCTEKLYEAFCATPPSARPGFAESVFERINGYWRLINNHPKVNILHFTFIEEDDRAFGNFAGKTASSFLYQVKKLNMLLFDGCRDVKNVYPIDLNYIQTRFGREIVFDEKIYYSAKMPLSTKVLPEVAKQVIDVVKALMGKIMKCVILDLDNTLWGGIIGDDGMDGIEIGELGRGHVFSDLQMWLRELTNRGIILAVCSKNNEDTAKEPFLKHPEMVLRLDDISMFVANWKDKASNISTIQQTLDIGMDSIVFLDDNPFERNLVRGLVPGITVPEMPEDPACYLSYLKAQNLFETATFSKADLDRTKQYQAEIGRTSLLKQFASFDDYLQSLEMVAEVKPFDSFNFPRIAQLTQRSNQFNLRTVRYSEAEVERVAGDDTYLTLYFTLRDKFGDHGLISVVIMEKQDDRTVFIDTWLMSCRVLKRGMEEFIINKVIEAAKAAGCNKVIGEYLKTPKNAMVADIYERMGFTSIGAGRYNVDAVSFGPYKTFITE